MGGEMKTRFQFRIATLLRLMVCVASFFGGRHWEQIAKAVRPKPRAVFDTDFQIVAGTKGVFNSYMPVTRMMIGDPSIATITPETSSTFTVMAKRAGTTKIQLWSDSTNQTATFNVTVK